ncbi:RNA polymerase sigma factor [Noviherbaspirillum galbum]|uniref:RNA polymerase sigma factor n=1 Tax=Noviherbaspirillum galbum TaxID=2709383 RepID=A0A6B3SH44_9BURK|nr:RNA polymerase sigma factor [Noviherbaspirillum galbum]NEX60181.1 RNA polymerase sigma factor [Noviherbaspirillum galbum]
MQDDSAQLMIACIPRLRRYARALIGDRTGADDLVQDTMERGWSRMSSWRSGSDMRAWLFGIMHNLHIDQVRRPSITTVELGDETPMPSIHAPQADRMQLRDMESALKTLPAEQREILLLVALEEMTYEEVSATLGIPVGTVMSRLSRARERLRAQMEGQTVASPLKVVK